MRSLHSIDCSPWHPFHTAWGPRPTPARPSLSEFRALSFAPFPDLLRLEDGATQEREFAVGKGREVEEGGVLVAGHFRRGKPWPLVGHHVPQDTGGLVEQIVNELHVRLVTV